MIERVVRCRGRVGREGEVRAALSCVGTLEGALDRISDRGSGLGKDAICAVSSASASWEFERESSCCEDRLKCRGRLGRCPRIML